MARIFSFKNSAASPSADSLPKPTDVDEVQQFEREKLAFDQNNQNLQQLNGILWRIPLFAMALTGGLWFGINNYQPGANRIIPILLLLFAAFANVVFSWILFRVRDLIGAHIEKVRDFYPDGFPTARLGKKIWQRDRFVVRSFALMMWIIAFMNLLFAATLAQDAGLLAPDTLGSISNWLTEMLSEAAKSVFG